MLGRFLKFVTLLSRHWVSALGVVLTSAAFVTFLFLEALRLAGLLTNAYVGLVTYLTLPALFVLGLVLIPIGWWRLRKKRACSDGELLGEKFGEDDVKAGPLGSRVFRLVLLLTVVNLVFLGFGTTRMLRFMDTPEFCGTACHVMDPEWTTYRQSPHADVACVKCHVGSTMDAQIDAKLNGLHQMIAITTGDFERPIPTPVHNLRPSKETCRRCHWPDMPHGDKIKVLARYGMDERSTPKYATLALKVGSPKRGAHWHSADANEVRFASVRDERNEVIWVEARQSDGRIRRYENRRRPAEATGREQGRTFDCVDCHNRASHIYRLPADLVDEGIREGEIDRVLPYVKREALKALTADYADGEEASRGIASRLRSFYHGVDSRLALQRKDEIDRTIRYLAAAWKRNVHPEMNIGWGTYEDHRGHRGANGGCFRCHNSDMVDETGVAIRSECTLCHSILAQDSAHPFQFLTPPDPSSPEAPQHGYLGGEFLDGLR
jgi:nitrate/TMAO reductase-like tetraheme cytochrome c subunit